MQYGDTMIQLGDKWDQRAKETLRCSSKTKDLIMNDCRIILLKGVDTIPLSQGKVLHELAVRFLEMKDAVIIPKELYKKIMITCYNEYISFNPDIDEEIDLLKMIGIITEHYIKSEPR